MRVTGMNAVLTLTFTLLLAAPELALAQASASASAPALAPTVVPTPEELIAAGVAARRDGDDERALLLFTQAWEQGHAPRARAQIGLAEQALGRFVEAEAHLAEALASRDDEWIVAQLTVLEGALAAVRARLRGEVPPPDADPASLLRLEARAQLSAGRAAFDSGAWEPALAAFERAHALTDDPDRLYDIAVACERLGRIDTAVERYEAYVLARPDATNRAAVDSRLRALRTQLALQRSAAEASERRLRERERERAEATRRAALARRAAADGGLLSKWWFWAAIGTVAATATVSAVVVLGDDAPAAIPGSGGRVLTALTVAP